MITRSRASYVSAPTRVALLSLKSHHSGMDDAHIDSRHLLLLSNSWNSGEGFLSHAQEWIDELFGNVRNLFVIDFAVVTESGIGSYAKQYLVNRGYEVTMASECRDQIAALKDAGGVFTLGGNTFLLLRKIQDHGLETPLRDFVRSGRPYLGASAGTNLACPTIMTTNDMPISEPKGFSALGLIGIQVNTHYIGEREYANHAGETRQERLQQFVLQSGRPVFCLPEGDGLAVNGSRVELLGPKEAYFLSDTNEFIPVAPGMINEPLNSHFAFEQSAQVAPQVVLNKPPNT